MYTYKDTTSNIIKLPNTMNKDMYVNKNKRIKSSLNKAFPD